MFKPLPPYGHAVRKALGKTPNTLVWIRYGNDGWTHCKVENDDIFIDDPIPQSLVMPSEEHWTDFWWPLKNSTVVIDWPESTSSEIKAFCMYLISVVRCKIVYVYDSEQNDVIKLEKSKRRAAA